MSAGILVPLEKIVAMRMLLENFDSLNARYETIPANDHGMRALEDMQTKITDFVRDLCND